MPDTQRAWRDHAACKGADPDLFFPHAGQSPVLAIAICHQCPVIDDCRRDAERIAKTGPSTLEPTGVWAGEVWIAGARVTGSGRTERPMRLASPRGHGPDKRRMVIDRYRETRHLYASDNACQLAVGGEFGLHGHTVRTWVHVADREAGT